MDMAISTTARDSRAPHRITVRMRAQLAVVKPSADKLDVPLVIQRESDTSRLASINGTIKPNEQYTKRQAVELTSIPLTVWHALLHPTSCAGLVRVPSVLRGRRSYIQGSDVLSFLATIEHIPSHTRTLSELCDLLDGPTFESMKQSFVWHEGSRYLPYRKLSDGQKVLIPLYRWVDGQTLLLDERDFQFIKEDKVLKQSRMSWEEAKNYMASQGVNLLDAQLKEELPAKRRKAGRASLEYLSPGGGITAISIFYLPSSNGKGRNCYLDRHDVESLTQKILADQKRFVPFVEALEILSLDPSATLGLTTKPRRFSIDGEVHNIRVYMKNRIRYMQRSDVKAYGQWRELYDQRDRDYVSVRKRACKAFKPEDWDRNYANFVDHLDNRGLDIVYPLIGIYELGVRVRELDGVFYVHTGVDDVVRFFINITHQDSRVRARTIKEFGKEVDAVENPARVNVHLAVKLWVARGIFMRDWSKEPKLARSAEIHFYNLFGGSKVADIFKTFTLDSLAERFENHNLDFRCYI